MTDQPAPRPADADIPAAVRAAFDDKRLQGAWNMASSAQSGDRQAGIEAACRLLARHGLVLGDVMTAVLAIPAKPAFGRSMEQAFGDIFADAFAGMKPASAAPVERPSARPRRRHVTGADIPPRVHGTVKVDDERDTRTGRMLVFTLSNADATFGPLVCFANGGIETLKAAAQEDEMLTMSVRQPHGLHQMPSVTGVRHV